LTIKREICKLFPTVTFVNLSQNHMKVLLLDSHALLTPISDPMILNLVRLNFPAKISTSHFWLCPHEKISSSRDQRLTGHARITARLWRQRNYANSELPNRIILFLLKQFFLLSSAILRSCLRKYWPLPNSGYKCTFDFVNNGIRYPDMEDMNLNMIFSYLFRIFITFENIELFFFQIIGIT